jgi:pimeloyl-ACP methyl ester carboxylesterase
VPTLLVNGLEDVPWMQDLAGLIAGGVPDVRRIDLPDTGHLPPLERPEWVAAEIRAFLDTL